MQLAPIFVGVVRERASRAGQMTRDRSHRNRQKSLQRSAAGLFFIVFLGLINLAILFLQHSPLGPGRDSSLTTSGDAASLPFLFAEWPAIPDADRSDTRPLYPYSVIPRGAWSRQELENALIQDPVAAAHYAGFRVHAAHVIRLAKERRAYVSYRLGNQIYWTRKKVTLRGGEALLTDGMHVARARCGNRVSETPKTPTSPGEPPAEVLQSPNEPVRQDLSTDPFPLVPEWAESMPVPPTLTGGTPPPGGVPPFPIIPICCAGGPPSGPPPVPPPPPVATPEPSSLALLVCGLVAALVLAKFRR